MTSTATKKRSNRDLRTEATREKVLDVATESIARKGYSGTTISALSKASGVMPASIYWHFGSKEGLLDAVIERAATAWFEGATRARSLSQDAPRDAIADHRSSLRYLFEEQPDFYRVLLLIGLERGSTGADPVEAVRRVRLRLRERLTERLVASLREEGVTEPELAVSLADMTLVLLDGFFVGEQLDGPSGPGHDERYDRIARLLRAVRRTLLDMEPGDRP